MLVTVFLTLGIGILVLGALSILYVDRTFRPHMRQCCRCLHSWTGTDTMCERCQSASHKGVRDSGTPTEHDWQGYLDTVPIPKVEA